MVGIVCYHHAKMALALIGKHALRCGRVILNCFLRAINTSEKVCTFVNDVD